MYARITRIPIISFFERFSINFIQKTKQMLSKCIMYFGPQLEKGGAREYKTEQAYEHTK